MNKLKVLIITYYWPPAGGSGVQRWLKFAKYLPEFDITPIIYTPENAVYPSIDEKLVAETQDIKVLKKPIFNPQDLLPKKKEKVGVANVSKGGLLSWIRGNFFIPDAKVFWVIPSVEYLSEYIVQHNVDVIISTGPPHSMHVIAANVKRKTNVKWIADFRDPWTTLYYNEDFNLTNRAKKKNLKLERSVLQNADVVVTVGNTLAEELSEKSANVKVITNGFDDEVLQRAVVLDTKFSIAHIGLLPKQSNPKILWEALKELCDTNRSFRKDLQINLIGSVCTEALDAIKTNGLDHKLRQNGYVSHSKAVRLQKQSQVLLLLIPNTKNSKGILTGKLFEYLKAKRPILAIGNEEGDVAEILQETKTGTIVDFEDKEKLKAEILNLYTAYKKGSLYVEASNTQQYHRKNLTAELANIIKNIIKN